MAGKPSALQAQLRWQLVAGLRNWAEGSLHRPGGG